MSEQDIGRYWHYIKRPSPMMRYPLTFWQDPLYWSLMDFDWYLHCNARLCEINRMRAIHFETGRHLDILAVTTLYLKNLEPYQVNYRGTEQGLIEFDGALEAIWGRRNRDLQDIYSLLLNEPCWLSLALYRYWRASEQGEDVLADMRANSALTEEFWEMIAERYDEIIGLPIQGSMEILGMGSLYNLFSLVDREYIAEVYGQFQKFPDGTPYFRQIPNLWDLDDSPRQWVYHRFVEIAEQANLNYFAGLVAAHQEPNSERGQQHRALYYTHDGISEAFTLARWSNDFFLPPLDLNSLFPGFPGFNDDIYRLPPLRKGELAMAKRSLQAGVDEIPFLTQEEYRAISPFIYEGEDDRLS